MTGVGPGNQAANLLLVAGRQLPLPSPRTGGSALTSKVRFFRSNYHELTTYLALGFDLEVGLLQNDTRLFEFQPRVARKELAAVSISKVADKIHSPFAVREKLSIHCVRIEAGHRPAIESQSSCSQNEIGALQRTVAEGGFIYQCLIPCEPGARIDVRK